MPIIILILIAVLVANIGFWDTFSAILGAIGVMILLFVLLVLLAGAVATYLWRRVRGAP